MSPEIHERTRLQPLLLALVTALVSGTAGAVDGVIEINNSRAVQGGVTPGDTAGYPVTIDQPGSYRLTGPLYVSGTNLDVVVVTAAHVTLDLNGFEIRCLYFPPTPCAGNGTGVGIRASADDLSVHNGVVRDMSSHGIVLGRAARVDAVRVLDNGGYGILLGDDGIVSNSIIRRNGFSGIYLGGDGAVILSSVIGGNGGYGIDWDYDGEVNRSFVYGHNSLLGNTQGPLSPGGAIQGVALQSAGNLCGVNSPGTCP